MGKHPGIEERRRPSATTYRARVRKGGVMVSRTFTTLSAALAWRAEAVEGMTDRGVLPAPPPPPPRRVATVADAARSLARGMVSGAVRTKVGTPYKPSVVRKYEEQLRTLIVPAIGDVPVGALTRGDVQRLVDGIAATRTPEHARKALVALRVALRVAERDGLIEPGSNPCAGVRAPADQRVERAARILTPQEVSGILAAAAADDARLGRSFGLPLLALLFGTGLRLGEALALPWGAEGLDLDAGVVRVRRSLDRVRDPQTTTFAFVAPKTRTSRRDVPVRPSDVAVLRRHRLASGRPREGELVFADERGRALTPNGRPRHAFTRAVRAAGLGEPAPKLHDLRHAYATALLAAGLTVHAVAELLGHSSPALVMARYGHAYAGEKAASAMALERFCAEVS
jgi:integrase